MNMPSGDKSSDTDKQKDKQKRQVARIGATVNKSSGGGKKRSSGRKHKSMTPMNARQIAAQLKQIPGWACHGQTITRTYKLEGFPLSIAFVERIAKRAEKMQHHPDIDIRYDEVTLALTTHDAGGLTKNDFALAAQGNKDFVKFTDL